jgi:SAM-dependent methyltransferase
VGDQPSDQSTILRCASTLTARSEIRNPQSEIRNLKSMTPQQFIAKWERANLSERSACQQHFLDLCELLGQPKPAAADPEGAWYCFERGVRTSAGGSGWADVWMKDHFGWEYKRKRRNLADAYNQLLQYRESLDNPPLLVVCDLDRFEIHTNFTGTAKQVHAFNLASLAEPKHLDILRRLFTNPESLKPGITAQSVTEQAAEHFGRLADGLRLRGVDPQQAAHFLMKLMFCMFAEDIELLPKQVFTRTLQGAKNDPARLTRFLTELFEAMAHGGSFALEDILYFNGGLFADTTAIELRPEEIALLSQAAAFDWSVVEPHIFGTLFERTLDPAKRSQIGAHYTSSDDIKTLLEPVMMLPLRRQWGEVQQQCQALLPKLAAEAAKEKDRRRRSGESKPRKALNKLIQDFVERLAHVTVLDPACGSGNFLYVALRLLLDLEKEVITYAARNELSLLPQVRPTQLHGIEINPFAQELAQVVIWIGYLQWMRDNGFAPPSNPVLEPIASIERRDAILDLSDPAHPKEPSWPAAEFIVGNPPFLGGKLLRANLGDDYVDAMFKVWKDRVPHEADLCCYWFSKAKKLIERKNVSRAGLLATQGIRGGANREILQHIKNSGDIFFAESDRDWVLDGAHVHVSMVGFDNGTESTKVLDGEQVGSIPATLSRSVDCSGAKRLACNSGISFMGITPSGPFVIDETVAFELLRLPNPHGRPNSDVMRPWVNGSDITGRSSGTSWIIDLSHISEERDAALYEVPFKYVAEHVREARKDFRTGGKKFWQFERRRPELRAALSTLEGYYARTMVGKHHIFVRLPCVILPANLVIAVTWDDPYHLGLLSSQIHEFWARSQGTQLRERESGFRYTPTTCFETFPFPEPTDAQREEIAAAAGGLDRLRSNWLNPPEWTRTETLTFPGSADGPWARYVTDGVVHYPRLVPKDEDAARELKKRTLTNLYNQRPAWLDLAHRRLDEAVLSAYAWPSDISDDELLARLLELNLARAQSEAKPRTALG